MGFDPLVFELVDREADRLGVTGLKDIFDAESGASRQRRILEESGAKALREALLIEPRV